jgi:cytochrome c peroxidase
MDCTRFFRSGPWLAAVCFALLWGDRPEKGLAGEPASPVPRDELGAATVAYQAELLAKLIPEAEAVKATSAFDPVVFAAYVPEDNALTAERVALGRKLYFDKRLSADGTVSCATCHDVT